MHSYKKLDIWASAANPESSILCERCEEKSMLRDAISGWCQGARLELSDIGLDLSDKVEYRT